MAKEKKIFGADVEEAKPKQDENNVEGMHEINATSGEDSEKRLLVGNVSPIRNMDIVQI